MHLKKTRIIKITKKMGSCKIFAKLINKLRQLNYNTKEKSFHFNGQEHITY